MSTEVTEARLPTRKGDEPLGDRESRAPKWEGGAHTGADADGPTLSARTRTRAVGLLRLAQDAGGVGSECETGLSAQKLEIVHLAKSADVAAQALPVVVLDAGTRIDEARAVLLDLKKTAPGCRVLVCAAGLDTDRMNELVGAGASDVARYPVTADALARKLDRVLRRGR